MKYIAINVSIFMDLSMDIGETVSYYSNNVLNYNF